MQTYSACMLTMDQGEDFDTASRKHRLFRKSDKKRNPDSVDVVNTLCNTLRCVLWNVLSSYTDGCAREYFYARSLFARAGKNCPML